MRGFLSGGTDGSTEPGGRVVPELVDASGCVRHRLRRVAGQRLLLRHLSLVIEKNRVVNLTRITSPQEALQLHVVDSLLPLARARRFALSGSSRFVDLGNGRRVPGHPARRHDGGRRRLLVDSVGKKVSRRQRVCRASSDSVAAPAPSTPASEELARRASWGRQDYVFARAVAQANVLVEYAAAAPARCAEGSCSRRAVPAQEELDASRARSGHLRDDPCFT